MEAAHKAPFDREKQFAAKRATVIRTAIDLFRRNGYHNTGMNDISEALGLTKAALYYYVSTKEEILFECHCIVYDAMDTVLQKTPDPGHTGLEYLCDIFFTLVELLTRDGLSLLTDIRGMSAEREAIVLERRANIEKTITNIVRAGIKDGSIRDDDPRLTVFFFMGAVNWLNAWYDPQGRIDGQTLATHFTDQMRRGIEKQ